jgi:hypothetical protein
MAPTQKNLVRLSDRMERNSKPDDWSTRIKGKEAVLFSAASAETHDPEPLALAVYWPCHTNLCSTPDTVTAMRAALQRLSLAPRFSEWVDESLDRPRRIGLLHTT